MIVCGCLAFIVYLYLNKNQTPPLTPQPSTTLENKGSKKAKKSKKKEQVPKKDKPLKSQPEPIPEVSDDPVIDDHPDSQTSSPTPEQVKLEEAKPSKKSKKKAKKSAEKPVETASAPQAKPAAKPVEKPVVEKA